MDPKLEEKLNTLIDQLKQLNYYIRKQNDMIWNERARKRPKASKGNLDD